MGLGVWGWGCGVGDRRGTELARPGLEGAFNPLQLTKPIGLEEWGRGVGWLGAVESWRVGGEGFGEGAVGELRWRGAGAVLGRCRGRGAVDAVWWWCGRLPGGDVLGGAAHFHLRDRFGDVERGRVGRTL